MKILITGGSRGIGRACVELFAKEGHEVVFFYRSSDSAANEICEKYSSVSSVKCDVSDPDEVRGATQRCAQILGGIDVLINNAGISEYAFFDTITDKQWQKMIGTNLSGTFYVTREISRYMISQKHGRIINVGSMWGKVGASCEVHYSAAKAGVRGMTMALAKELAPSGITVNCIEPGVIATEMNASLDADTLQELCDETPVCRLGTVDDVVNAVEFFASEKSSFITGQILGVDGGFAI